MACARVDSTLQTRDGEADSGVSGGKGRECVGWGVASAECAGSREDHRARHVAAFKKLYIF